MKLETVRGTLAIMTVGLVLLTSAVIALVPILSDYEANRAQVYSEFLKTYMGIFAGIVGLIFGYYFGRSSSSEPPPKLPSSDT